MKNNENGNTVEYGDFILAHYYEIKVVLPH